MNRLSIATHLSLDGLKLPGNASREGSGTFPQLRFKPRS
jgi:hypothetical protein